MQPSRRSEHLDRGCPRLSADCRVAKADERIAGRREYVSIMFAMKRSALGGHQGDGNMPSTRMDVKDFDRSIVTENGKFSERVGRRHCNRID